MPCSLKLCKGGNFHERMEILLLPDFLLKTLGFVAKKLCGGWLDDAWPSKLQNFGFQVSSKNNTGPMLCMELHVHGLQSLGHNFVGE